MRFSDTVGCIGSEVPPKLSKSEQHMLFQYPGKDHCVVAADAQFHHQVLQSSSKKGSAEEMLASLMQILVMVWWAFGSLHHNIKMRIQNLFLQTCSAKG